MNVDPATGEITEEQPGDFAALLVGHLNGRTHETASTEFHQLIAAVTAHSKKGSFALIVTVEPSKGHVDGDPLSISIDTVLKAPKAVAPASLYFVGADGNPTRDDPRQLTIPFRTVPATDNTTLRSV